MASMKKIAVILFVFACCSCSENRAPDAASPGTLPANSEVGPDTNRLVTDSVLIRDSNAADIETMKKIN